MTPGLVAGRPDDAHRGGVLPYVIKSGPRTPPCQRSDPRLTGSSQPAGPPDGPGAGARRELASGGGHRGPLFVLGAVPEHRGQPPLGLGDRPALAAGVVLDLVAA